MPSSSCIGEGEDSNPGHGGFDRGDRVKRIYLDHTATTPVDRRVLEAMEPFFTNTFGNPSSVHAFGREARQFLERARETIAVRIGARPGELFFTSGGTESNNLAIRGTVLAACSKLQRAHLITSRAEHHAVLEPAESLREDGIDVTVLDVDGYGSVAPDGIADAMSPATCLVSIMAGNNEVGTLSPVSAIGDVCRSRKVLFHSDAVQALGKIRVDITEWGADLVTLSAHKIYGPKGIGALFVRQGTAIDPIIRGGGQERGKRPGTESLPLAVGFARAVEIAVETMGEESKRLSGLRDHLCRELQGTFPGLIVNSPPGGGLPHILSISFDSSLVPLEGEMLVHNMDLEGIAVSSGSACTSGSIQPSHVLLAMGRDPATAKSTIRFSFGRDNTSDDIPLVMSALRSVLARMKRP